MDEKKYGAGALKKTEMDRILRKAREWDADSTIKKAVPHLAAKYVTNDELKNAKEKDKNIDTKEKLIMSKMKPADYKNISAEALKEREIVDAILTTAMGGHISQLIEQHGTVAAKTIEDRIDAGAFVNPRLKKYLTRGVGAVLISPKTPPKDWTSSPLSTPPTPPGGPTPSTPPLPKPPSPPGAPKRGPNKTPSGAPKRP